MLPHLVVGYVVAAAVLDVECDVAAVECAPHAVVGVGASVVLVAAAGCRVATAAADAVMDYTGTVAVTFAT